MQFTQWDNSSLNLLQEDMQDNFKIKAQWARLPSSILLPCLFDADFKLLLRSKRVIWGHNVRDALQWVFDKWKMADFGSRLSFQIHLKSTWRSSSKLSQTGSDRRNLYYSSNPKSMDFSWFSVPVRNLHPGTPVLHNVQFVLTWKRVISSELHHFLFFCKIVFFKRIKSVISINFF